MKLYGGMGASDANSKVRVCCQKKRESVCTGRGNSLAWMFGMYVDCLSFRTTFCLLPPLGHRLLFECLSMFKGHYQSMITILGREKLKLCKHIINTHYKTWWTTVNGRKKVVITTKDDGSLAFLFISFFSLTQQERLYFND